MVRLFNKLKELIEDRYSTCKDKNYICIKIGKETLKLLTNNQAFSYTIKENRNGYIKDSCEFCNLSHSIVLLCNTKKIRVYTVHNKLDEKLFLATRNFVLSLLRNVDIFYGLSFDDKNLEFQEVFFDTNRDIPALKTTKRPKELPKRKIGDLSCIYRTKNDNSFIANID